MLEELVKQKQAAIPDAEEESLPPAQESCAATTGVR
jgi:hypothetical protein